MEKHFLAIAKYYFQFFWVGTEPAFFCIESYLNVSHLKSFIPFVEILFSMKYLVEKTYIFIYISSFLFFFFPFHIISLLCFFLIYIKHFLKGNTVVQSFVLYDGKISLASMIENGFIVTIEREVYNAVENNMSSFWNKSYRTLILLR